MAHRHCPNREGAEAWTRDILGLDAHAPSRDATLLPALRACLAIGPVDGFAHRRATFACENLHREAPVAGPWGQGNRIPI